MKKQKENSHEGITWSEMGKQNVQAEKVYCDAIYRRVLRFVSSMNHIPPYLHLSRTDDDDVRDIGKHEFRQPRSQGPFSTFSKWRKDPGNEVGFSFASTSLYVI